MILYQLVHGHTLYGKNTSPRDKIFRLKQREAISFCKPISKDLEQLLRRILEFDVKKRITLHEIFEHPWITKLAIKHSINIRSFLDQNRGLVTSERSSLVKPPSNIHNRHHSVGRSTFFPERSTTAETKVPEKARQSLGDMNKHTQAAKSPQQPFQETQPLFTLKDLNIPLRQSKTRLIIEATAINVTSFEKPQVSRPPPNPPKEESWWDGLVGVIENLGCLASR